MPNLQKVEESHYSYNGGPDSNSLFGVLPQVRAKGILNFFSDIAEQYGDIIPYRLGFKNYVQLNHPDLIQYVLVDNHKNYRKSDSYLRFKPFIGGGLLTTHGEKWRKDRQLLQPLFKRELIEGYYAEIINDVLDAIIEEWKELAHDKTSVNVTTEMSRITLKVILKSMFGTDVADSDLKRIDEATRFLMDYATVPRLFPKVDLKQWVDKETYTKAMEYNRFLHDFIDAEVERVGASIPSDNERTNMTAILMHLRFDDGAHMNAQDQGDHAVTMLFAGYETTAIMLQWFWYALDRNQTAQQQLLDELQGIKSINFKAVMDLPYLDRVFKEVARMYPSFWITTRAPLQDDLVGGYKVAKGTTLVLPQYIIQRSKRYWQDPEKFDTERFNKENEGKIPSGAYFPFSLGPRKCIGFRFAEMEAKMVISKLLKQFKLTMHGGGNVEIDPVVSLRMKQDLQMRVEVRSHVQQAQAV